MINQQFAIWTAAGLIGFSLYVFVVFRTGLLYLARHADGTLKEKVPLKGRLVGLPLILLWLGLVLGYGRFGVRPYNPTITFFQLFLLNSLMFCLIFLFDTFLIDWFIIVKWRPAFLRIPSAMDAAAMRQHINASLKKGGAIVLLAGLVSTTIVWSIVFRSN